MGLILREDFRVAFWQLGILILALVYILKNHLYIKHNSQPFAAHQVVHGYNTRHKTDLMLLYCRLMCQDGPGHWGIHFFNILSFDVPKHVLNKYGKPLYFRD